MKWCCTPFRAWYEVAGQRGFAILIGRDSKGLGEFTVQHRLADKNTPELPPTDYPVSIISEIDISYCPWCGRNLKEWYAKDISELYRPGLRIDPP
jgi:hypothetical protein